MPIKFVKRPEIYTIKIDGTDLPLTEFTVKRINESERSAIRAKCGEDMSLFSFTIIYDSIKAWRNLKDQDGNELEFNDDNKREVVFGLMEISQFAEKWRAGQSSPLELSGPGSIQSSG